MSFRELTAYLGELSEEEPVKRKGPRPEISKPRPVLSARDKPAALADSNRPAIPEGSKGGAEAGSAIRPAHVESPSKRVRPSRAQPVVPFKDVSATSIAYPKQIPMQAPDRFRRMIDRLLLAHDSTPADALRSNRITEQILHAARQFREWASVGRPMVVQAIISLRDQDFEAQE